MKNDSDIDSSSNISVSMSNDGDGHNVIDSMMLYLWQYNVIKYNRYVVSILNNNDNNDIIQ